MKNYIFLSSSNISYIIWKTKMAIFIKAKHKKLDRQTNKKQVSTQYNYTITEYHLEICQLFDEKTLLNNYIKLGRIPYTAHGAQITTTRYFSSYVCPAGLRKRFSWGPSGLEPPPPIQALE